jgi:hypothetical protein
MWKHSGSPEPKKFKQTFRGKKLMAPVISGGRRGGGGGGVLLVEFINAEATITSVGYCETFKQLRRATQNNGVAY